MSVGLAEWTALLRAGYLQEFVPAGGAAVKIAVAPPEHAAPTREAVAGTARELGYVVAEVDAGETRVHMVDQLFFAVARQLDWEAVTAEYLRKLFQKNGIVPAEGRPLADLDALAAANGRFATDLLPEINRLIVNDIVKDYALSREFRTAIAMLCRGHINPQNVSPTDAELIQQWLRGEKCSLTALKHVQIFQRVGRQNARLLLGSLARWLRHLGAPGLALVMDWSAVVTERAPTETRLRYTRSAVLDAYEVLRQFIDDVDEVENLLVVAIAGPGLVDDPRRSLENYTALKMRVVDEVRDRHRSNPLNTMVRLDAGAPAGRGEAP